MGRVGFIVCVNVFAATVLLGSPASAHAETLGLVVLTPEETPISRVALERAMRLALIGAGHQVVVDPVARARQRVADGAVLADRLRPFSRAEDLLSQGWKAYAQVQMGVAKARLSAARQAALEVSDLAGGVALVAETSLRLGVIEHELGEQAEAAADFRLANRLAPERAVTDDEFKPAVVTAFRAALAAPTVKRPVAVSVKPARSTVEIDGTARGKSELELEVGLHLLVVRAPGMIAAGSLAAVTGAGPAEIGATLALEPATAGLFAGNIEVGTSGKAAAAIIESTLLFAELDGALVVAAAWRGEDMVLVAQRCGGSPLRCTGVLEGVISAKAALAIASSELVERSAAVERRATTIDTPSLEEVVSSREPVITGPVITNEPWWKNRWLWVGVGAAALAAGTTAIVLSIDGNSPLVISADPCQFGRC